MIDRNYFDHLEGAVDFVLQHEVDLWKLSPVERHRAVLHHTVQTGALWIKAMTHVWRDAGMEPPMPTFIMPRFIVPDPELMDLFEHIIKQQYPALQRNERSAQSLLTETSVLTSKVDQDAQELFALCSNLRRFQIPAALVTVDDIRAWVQLPDEMKVEKE